MTKEALGCRPWKDKFLLVTEPSKKARNLCGHGSRTVRGRTHRLVLGSLARAQIKELFEELLKV